MLHHLGAADPVIDAFPSPFIFFETALHLRSDVTLEQCVLQSPLCRLYLSIPCQLCNTRGTQKWLASLGLGPGASHLARLWALVPIGQELISERLYPFSGALRRYRLTKIDFLCLGLRSWFCFPDAGVYHPTIECVSLACNPNNRTWSQCRCLEGQVFLLVVCVIGLEKP